MLESKSDYHSDDRERTVIPNWGFVLLFFGPATLSIVYFSEELGLNLSDTFQNAVLVLNASVNLVIAYLTITIYGTQNEIMDQADEVVDMIGDVSEATQFFVSDISEAKSVFTQVGLDISSLDLEPVADVVEKLKENKPSLTEIFDNMKEVDISKYISQAKRIDWQALLDSAEEIMGFIENQKGLEIPTPSVTSTNLPKIGEDLFLDDEDEDFFDETDLDLQPPSKNLDLQPPRRPK